MVNKRKYCKSIFGSNERNHKKCTSRYLNHYIAIECILPQYFSRGSCDVCVCFSKILNRPQTLNRMGIKLFPNATFKYSMFFFNTASALMKEVISSFSHVFVISSGMEPSKSETNQTFAVIVTIFMSGHSSSSLGSAGQLLSSIRIYYFPYFKT